MFLLVPAHPGCPRQNPDSCKTVVCVCMLCLLIFPICFLFLFFLLTLPILPSRIGLLCFQAGFRRRRLILVFITRDSVAIAHICYGNSVCPSVTRVDQSKTVEARITQFSPYSSPIPLVFRG